MLITLLSLVEAEVAGFVVVVEEEAVIEQALAAVNYCFLQVLPIL
jgi:hypothetical protein